MSRTDYEIAERLAEKAAKRDPKTPELIEYTDRLWEFANAAVKASAFPRSGRTATWGTE